jgi:hypothetical protein
VSDGERGATGPARPYRAGAPIQDLCRACHALRDHTVMAVDGNGRPLRVVCGFCGSQHNYRGGAEDASKPSTPRMTGSAPHRDDTPFALVSERERTGEPMTDDTAPGNLETLLRRVIREESGLTAVGPAEKWRDGQMVLRPGKPGLQEKTWPIETFFHKVVMVRNRLRTLEQQLNAADLPEDLKVRLQGYITGCYGSLTSFNVLFADETDQFKGAGGE